MEDNKIIKIAISASIFGLILLYYATIAIEAKSYSISQIDKSMLDQDVKIRGKITNIIKTEKVLILNVKDGTGSIMVASFNPKEVVEIKNGLDIEVIGKVSIYKNKIEIIADSIKRIYD